MIWLYFCAVLPTNHGTTDSFVQFPQNLLKIGGNFCATCRDRLKQAVVIDANEVREILAEKFQVPMENVIKSQYSYTVILPQKDAAEVK